MSNIVHREVEVFVTGNLGNLGNLSVTLKTIQDQHSKPFKTQKTIARWFGPEVIRLAIQIFLIDVLRTTDTTLTKLRLLGRCVQVTSDLGSIKKPLTDFYFSFYCAKSNCLLIGL